MSKTEIASRHKETGQDENPIELTYYRGDKYMQCGRCIPELPRKKIPMGT